MDKTRLAPLYFPGINEREKDELARQLKTLERMYGADAVFLPPAPVGSAIPPDADAVVLPQLVGEAFRLAPELQKIKLPVIALTSSYGTVEMWDWEIVSFLREEKGMTIFAPYSPELARCALRAVVCRKALKSGARFLIFQDSPGEGMQANIFKRFYWWEEQCTKRIEEAFGLSIVYKSYKALWERASAICDAEAEEASKDWDVPMSGGVTRGCAGFLKAVKLYMAVKEAIAETEKEAGGGAVAGVGSNCLNESFNSGATPCLAWNMLYERDGLLWACEGDTVSLVSKYIFGKITQRPLMMTNIYPFLVGMAALAHEKIDRFPDIENPDNHALGVHCGYFGMAPQSFCESWTLCPKVLGIVNDDALMVDCRFAKGPVVLAKLHTDMKKLTAIRCEIEDYAQYPGSDCRNGALLRYKNDNGHEIMDALCSHHAIIIRGDCVHELRLASELFGFSFQVL